MSQLKAFKYRLYPHKQQEVLLNKTFGCVRVIWNHHVEVFNQFDKNKTEQASELSSTELRKKFNWMQEVSAAALQQKEIDFKTFKKNYFSKTRKKKIGRPAFKKRDTLQSFRLPNQKFTLYDTTIRLEKIGKVKLMIDREIPKGSKLMSVTISKNRCNQFFASILIECEIAQKPKTGKSVGIDIGITTFLTLSNHSIVANPRYFRESQMKIAQLQRHLSRKKKGSMRRRKAKLKVARLHNKIANQR